MNTRAKNGFTLLELLTIVGVIGITGCIAIPMVMNILPNKNLRSMTRQIHSSLILARSEASRRNTSVMVAINPSKEHILTSCVDNGKTPAAGTNVGTDKDGKCKGKEVLQRGPALPNRVTFDGSVGNGKGTDFPDSAVIFTSRGVPKWYDECQPKQPTGCSIALCTTDLSGEPSKNCRKISVSAAGRVKIAVTE